MRAFLDRLTIPCAVFAVVVFAAPVLAEDSSDDATGRSGAASAQQNGQNNGQNNGQTGGTNSSGAASVSGPDEPATHLKPPIPALHLTDADRQKIRAAVAGKDTEVTFQLKAAKPHKDFQPKVGEKIPPHLPAHALPSELTQQLPMLADYKYMKVKQQLLIVNPMTGKIVDMFPEAQS
ncbi:MAG: hypothetical protein WBD48_05830 [Pseudolabrys sp.]